MSLPNAQVWAVQAGDLQGSPGVAGVEGTNYARDTDREAPLQVRSALSTSEETIKVAQSEPANKQNWLIDDVNLLVPDITTDFRLNRDSLNVNLMAPRAQGNNSYGDEAVVRTRKAMRATQWGISARYPNSASASEKNGTVSDIASRSYKLGESVENCVKEIESLFGVEEAVKKARKAAGACFRKGAAAQTCCKGNPVDCLKNSGYQGLITSILNAAPVAANIAITKRCGKVKALLGTATTLTSATAQLCQGKVSSCATQCEQKTAAAIEELQKAVNKLVAEPPSPSEIDADVAVAGQINGCLEKIINRAQKKAYKCVDLSDKVLPLLQSQMMTQMLGSQVAARCEAVTANTQADPVPEIENPCTKNPQASGCPQAQQELSLKPGLVNAGLGAQEHYNYDLDEGPAVPDGANDYLGNGEGPTAKLGGVQGGGGSGGGGGGLGGGGGGGGGSGAGASRKPAAASPGAGSAPGSILKGFSKGGGFSSAGGSGGGYSQRAGGGYGSASGKNKRLFNLGKYFKKSKGSALNKVNRNIASAASSIWINIAQRYKAVCHKQKLYCEAP